MALPSATHKAQFPKTGSFDKVLCALQLTGMDPPWKKRRVCEITDDQVLAWVKEKVEELCDQAVADACVAGLDGYTARALLQASREDIAANLKGKVAPKLVNKVSRSLYNCIHPELLPSPPVLRL